MAKKKKQKIDVQISVEDYMKLADQMNKEWEETKANPLVKQLMDAMKSI